MTTCDSILELLPWYVNGSLSVEESRQVAAHVATCERCRDELVEMVRLRVEIRQAVDGQDGLNTDAKQDVLSQTTGRTLANVNIGSFLLGLSFGASYQKGRLPVRGDLNVLGRRIRLLSTSKEEPNERQGTR